jgi:hypothetical protein
MKRPLIIIVSVLALVAAFAGGYLFGSRSEREIWQSSVVDAQTSKTLVGIGRDIQLLTVVREKAPFDWVKELELWTVVQLQHVDPATFTKGSNADYIYPKTIEAVNAYRKRYPDTAINPEREPTIAKAFAASK